jgi:prephenate dehydrogenase
MIDHLSIIGVGLIGSSLALALKQAGYVKKVTGYGRNIDKLKLGVQLGVLDCYQTSIADAVKDVDVVVIAVPLGAMDSVFAELAESISETIVITDVGSAKASVIDCARTHLGEGVSRFVAGHPIAGTEKSGIEAGFATLFQDRKIILTPVAETSIHALEVVRDMWQACSAEVESMDVRHHDRVLAATSHLPHMLAFSLVSHLSKMSDQDEIFSYAAGGFRDFTRIASSDPVMWRDICLANSEALLELIEGYQHELDSISKAIREHDADALYDSFKDAKHTRDQLRKL